MSTSTVPLFHQDGSAVDIPADRASAAIKSGKFTQGATLYHVGTGEESVIPMARAKEALASGKFTASKPTPKEPTEQDIKNRPTFGSEFASSVGGMVESIPSLFESKHPTEIEKKIPGAQTAHNIVSAPYNLVTGMADFMTPKGDKPEANAAGSLLNSMEHTPALTRFTQLAEQGNPLAATGALLPYIHAVNAPVQDVVSNVGERAIADYSPAVRKYISDSLNHYAAGVGSRRFDVAPNTKTGINAGLEVARVIEPLEKMKNQEANLSKASLDAQARFTDKAMEHTRAGVVIDVLPEFTAETTKLVREARNVRPGIKVGALPSTVEQAIAFFDKWNEGGRLAKLTPNDAMVLKQDLDSIVRDPHGSVPSLVKVGAEKLRTLIDQKMDKQVTGWKDYNHAASGLIEASEKAAEKTALAAKGKLAAQLRILVSMPSASEAAVMVPVIAGTYFLSETLGGGMYGHIAVTTGLVSAFRALAKGMPSASTRMALATRFADLLYKEKMSGPSSYPPMGGGGAGGVGGGGELPPGGGLPPGGQGGKPGIPPPGPTGQPSGGQGQISPTRVLQLMEQAKEGVMLSPEQRAALDAKHGLKTSSAEQAADTAAQRGQVDLMKNPGAHQPEGLDAANKRAAEMFKPRPKGGGTN